LMAGNSGSSGDERLQNRSASDRLRKVS
jgi:hypothetical protein